MLLPFPNQRFMQVCWIVPDIHAAMAAWTRTTGVGPFFYFDTVPFDEPCYRGTPAESPPLAAAMAQAGDIQIELVSPLDDRTSFITDVVPCGHSGLHHLALYCQDYDAELTAYTQNGAEVAFSCRMMGSRTCWVDTTATLGFMVELIEANTVADAVFAQFRAAASDWDGRDPVRTLG